ncbi:hypothetical protein J3R82DRAFT_8542 [Butyriboletus roseoflavus]|nr:hypothetical protein J3R82DRAFT_8542 [Butyriboletus roseoflavus]
MLQSYLKDAKLHSWLSHPQCPPAVQEFKVLLDCAYGNTPGDNSFANSLDSTKLQKAVAVPSDLQRLVNRCTSLHAHIKLAGMVYSNRLLSPVPGSIKYIYETAAVLMFAIQRQCTLPADGNSADIFAAYPHFPAKLYSSALCDVLESVQIGWVTGHYAQWVLKEDFVVVLSLSWI